MSALTDWAASVLETDEEILVPVKKLWKEYAQISQVSLDEFTRALEGDARFEFMGGVDHRRDLEDLAEEELGEHIEEMEALGYFSGPRVKMKDREITPEHIAKMLKKHTDRMMESLWAAFDVRPEDLPKGGDEELLDLIARAKELQLKVQEVLPPPPGEDASQESAKKKTK